MASSANNPMLATLRTSVSTLSASLETKELELQKCRADLADAKQKAHSLQQQLQDGQREAAAAQEKIKQANTHTEDARREVVIAQEAADKTLREAWQEASEQALREAARHHASAMREEKDAARRAFPPELKQRDMVAEVIASRDRKVAVLIKSASEQIALLSARSSALHRGVLHDVDLHGDGSHSSGDTDDCPRDSPELHRRR